MKAALPKDEAARLAALHDLEVLDTSPEQEFDSVVRLVARLLDVPIALVSLIDAERQWFKACVGLSVRETDRSHAFCAHAILDPNHPLIVEDATKDPRFADNPLVTGPPNIRYYVGVPLVSREGAALGTLCAIDQWPRRPTADQVELLRDQARVVVDQLELRRASRKLLERNRELERSNALLKQFARALAHDVMAPIQQVSFFADQLEENVAPGGLGALEDLRGSAERAERLVVALRDYVATGGTFPLVPTKLGPVVEQAIADMKASLDDVHATVTVSELPTVLADPEHLSRVIVNLLTNSVKYRSVDPLELEIGAQRRDDVWRVHVKDNGIGIPVDHHERVFEPMRRLHGEGEIPGVGLGLALVRQVVETSGGRVGIESEVGRGTTVWFELCATD